MARSIRRDRRRGPRVSVRPTLHRPCAMRRYRSDCGSKGERCETWPTSQAGREAERPRAPFRRPARPAHLPPEPNPKPDLALATILCSRDHGEAVQVAYRPVRIETQVGNVRVAVARILESWPVGD